MKLAHLLRLLVVISSLAVLFAACSGDNGSSSLDTGNGIIANGNTGNSNLNGNSNDNGNDDDGGNTNDNGNDDDNGNSGNGNDDDDDDDDDNGNGGNGNRSSNS